MRSSKIFISFLLLECRLAAVGLGLLADEYKLTCEHKESKGLSCEHKEKSDLLRSGIHHGHLARRSTHQVHRLSSHPCCGLRASSAASAAPSGPPGSSSTIASILRLPGLLGLVCVPCVRDLPQLRRRPGNVEHAALMDAAFQAVPEYHARVNADHFVLSAERPAKRFACKPAHLMELRDGGLIILRISEISLNAGLG